MKKTYIYPRLRVVITETEEMLAGSQDGDGISVTSAGAISSYGSQGVDNSDVKAQGSFDWGNEW